MVTAIGKQELIQKLYLLELEDILQNLLKRTNNRAN